MLSHAMTLETTASDAVLDAEADHALVRAAGLGDSRAFEALYRKHSRRVFAVVWRLSGGQVAQAEDLVQDAFVRACRDTYGLTVEGLMCIPPFDESPAPHFALLAKIARRNDLASLSMGMSADFPLAIALGATYVRVGTAIFGGRTAAD